MQYTKVFSGFACIMYVSLKVLEFRYKITPFNKPIEIKL